MNTIGLHQAGFQCDVLQKEWQINIGDPDTAWSNALK